MQDLIQTLKARPEHVRERVALLVAGSVTAVIALGWMVALVSSGTFALNTPGASSSDNASSIDQAFSQAASGFSALQSSLSGNSSDQKSGVTIVETSHTSTVKDANASGPTTIPF